jgi:hypothetical protein
VIAVDRIVRDIINGHDFAGIPNLITDRGPQLQLSTGNKTKIDFIPHRTGDPVRIRHPRNSRKPHPCGTENDFENRFDRINPRDGGEVTGEIVGH